MYRQKKEFLYCIYYTCKTRTESKQKGIIGRKKRYKERRREYIYCRKKEYIGIRKRSWITA